MTATVALVRRMLHERRRLLFWLCLSTVAMVLAVMALYSSIGEQYGTLFEDLPDAILNLFGGGDFSTPAGYLETELLSFVAPGMVVGIAIAFGAGSLAGSEQSGHLALVFTAPIPRRRVALAALTTMTIAVLAMTITAWLSMLVGNEIGGVHVSVARLGAVSVMLGLLGIATGAIAFAVGAATGARGLAVGVGTAVSVGSYLVYALAPLSDTTNPLRYASIWYPYSANRPLLQGLSVAHALVLVAVAIGAAGAGVLALDRRDVQG